jgi:hypothetical protein
MPATVAGLPRNCEAFVGARRRAIAGDVGDAAADDRPHLVLEFFERMSGEIQPERVALAIEAHAAAPVRQHFVAERDGRPLRRVVHQPEHVVLAHDAARIV